MPFRNNLKILCVVNVPLFRKTRVEYFLRRDGTRDAVCDGCHIDRQWQYRLWQPTAANALSRYFECLLLVTLPSLLVGDTAYAAALDADARTVTVCLLVLRTVNSHK